MYTQTTVTMANFEPGSGKVWNHFEWGSIHEERYRNIFKDEIALVKKGERGTFFEWGCLPRDIVDSMTQPFKILFLEEANRGWFKVADHGNFCGPWHWEDMDDVEKACEVALALIDAKLNLLHSFVPQGPLHIDDQPWNGIAQRQLMLSWAAPPWEKLRRTILENVLPNVQEARDMLRSRMGQVDLTAECYCQGCGKMFSGAKGFVVLDPPRRGGNPTTGIKCLDCFGH